MIEDIDVQFALFGQAGHRQVAAAKETGFWIRRILAEMQIELCMEVVSQKQLDDKLL